MFELFGKGRRSRKTYRSDGSHELEIVDLDGQRHVLRIDKNTPIERVREAVDAMRKKMGLR